MRVFEEEETFLGMHKFYREMNRTQRDESKC